MVPSSCSFPSCSVELHLMLLSQVPGEMQDCFILGKTWHCALFSITDQVLVLTLIFLSLLCIHYKPFCQNLLFILILYSRCGFRPKKYVWIFFFIESMALNSYVPSPRLLQNSDFRLGDSTMSQHYKHFL